VVVSSRIKRELRNREIDLNWKPKHEDCATRMLKNLCNEKTLQGKILCSDFSQTILKTAGNTWTLQHVSEIES
jgi:hypothetical protein